jgi:hypothetical protein
MRLLRFKCNGCGLEMALAEKPEECLCCGSRNIVREGWKLRYSAKDACEEEGECD